jgi:hypothetical protein
LELIHSDIWTSPIQSISGCKYHVVFIDDFFRYTWIYPLYQKSEVFDTFVKFKLLVENQFSTKIKQFQSDGGGEYTSVHFQSFLTNNGILHRKSCPYTSPHNGLAERKLRHILDTGLTLLAHSHLSNRYWVDAFLTVVYIINRLPTPTLQYKSPYLKLYKHDPDYQNLRVFGCLCYNFLRPYASHKLEYRSKPCIFLGYQFAGYKCLDPVTNKVYLSRHVIFNEDFFPAKDQTTSKLPSRISAQGDAPFILHVPFTNAPFMQPVSSPPTIPSSHSAPLTLSHDIDTSLDTTFDSIITITPHNAPSAPSPPIQPTNSSHTLGTQPHASTTHDASYAPSPLIQPTNSSHTLDTQPHASTSNHPMVTRSRIGSLKPKTFANYQLHHTTQSEKELVSYNKTALDPRWREAMKLEYDALMSNGT